jgi:hypothetical protein
VKPPICEKTGEFMVSLCQDGCGLRPVCLLTPCENDPPGLCDRCGGQTCDCEGCLEWAAVELN